MSTMIERMIGAARLDVPIIEEIEHDQDSTLQALGVVALSALCAGIGGAAVGGAGALVGITLAALVGWVLWAGVIYLVGGKLLPTAQTEVDMGQLLRTLGFAQSPGVLRIFGIIPVLGPLIQLVASIWMLVAMVVAVRQALDYDSTGRAIGVVFLGFLAYLLSFGILFSIFGSPV